MAYGKKEKIKIDVSVHILIIFKKIQHDSTLYSIE